MKNFKGISIYLIICGLLLMGTGCSSLQNNQALKDELKTQVTNELKPQLKEELKQELKKELKEELTADLNKQAEQKAAAAPAPAASSTTNTPVKKTRHYTFWAEGAARIQTYDQVKKGTYASCQYVRQCSSCGKVQDNTAISFTVMDDAEYKFENDTYYCDACKKPQSYSIKYKYQDS